MNFDEKYMRRALKLAAKSGRDVAPNPMVGAVIVKSGRVIGEGYHEKFSGSHAEVMAIRSVKNKKDLVGSTMYVTLEPCRHHGKTPPCIDLIERVGIACVVVGSRDPFQKRFKLNATESHLEYLTGNITDQCRQLNKFYFNWIEKKQPYITVKIAVSADGFVAGEGGKPIRITNHRQDIEVHKLRFQHQAIMVGINTVLTDDPKLTVRLVKGRDPLRIILDSKLRIPMDAKVLEDDNYLIVTVKQSSHRRPANVCRPSGGEVNVWLSPTKKRISLKKLFAYLAKQGISSVLVEPGPTLYQSLKKAGLIDELIVFRGKKCLNEGLKWTK